MLDVLLTATERGATMGGRTREDIARRLMQKRQRLAERSQIVAALDFLARWGAISAQADEALNAMQVLIASEDVIGQRHLAHWAEVLDLLKIYDVASDKILIQPDLARSWDYYTGVVFELHTADGRHLGGGGRYDELAHLIGDPRNIPAVGFAYYMEQMLQALPSTYAEKSPVAIGITPKTRADGARWAHLLRSRSIAARLLPLADVQGEALALSIHEDGSAEFKLRHFHTDAVDELIAELT
jgi:histidyl-tRNA synthetase